MKSSFDFARRRLQPWLSWAVLACGGAALIAAVNFDQRVSADRTALVAAKRSEADAERERRKPKPVVAPSVSELRAQLAMTQVHAPWLATLRLIETTTEAPVYLRALAIDAGSNLVKLEAEADSFDDALEYTAALSQEALLAPAVLTSHDQAVSALGKPVVHFNVAARWNRP